MSTPTLAAPVQQTDRIILLDSLRGFAILGILMMNIPGFAQPSPLYMDPSLMNELGTINYKIWYFVEWFLAGSQRALFSMLFGAGIILFVSRQEKKLQGIEPAHYFFRRQVWLMVFSTFDVYVLLWFWDILFDYAALGMIMFIFRNWKPKFLIIGAAVCLLFMTLRENRDFYEFKNMLQKGETIAAIDTTKTKLSDKQKEELEAYTGAKERNSKEAKSKVIKKQTEATLGSYAELYKLHSDRYVSELVQYLYFGCWDVLIFMFLGMAFFKLGILTGEASARTYLIMCVVGLTFGLIMSYSFLQPWIDAGFNRFVYAKTNGVQYYQLSRVFRSLGIFAFIMLLYKSGWFKWLFAMLRPVGQMAFTNYLMQSTICGLIFYGIGFGLFGKLQRIEIYYVVGAVWVFQIIFCNVWLRYFLYGPLEWTWRSLTYWKKQPFVNSQGLKAFRKKPAL